MLKRSDLFLFLVLELVAIVIAGASFSLIESRLAAGFVAGSYFLGFGLYVLSRLYRSGQMWKMIMTYPLLVHVFAISLPLMITRLLTMQDAFESVFVLGLPGPVFHRLSTTIFSILILGTLIDLGRVWRGDSKIARANI